MGRPHSGELVKAPRLLAFFLEVRVGVLPVEVMEPVFVVKSLPAVVLCVLDLLAPFLVLIPVCAPRFLAFDCESIIGPSAAADTWAT